MRNFFILTSIFVLCVSCKNNAEKPQQQTTISVKNYDHIEKLQWLVGNWANITIDQQSYESWTQPNDSTLSAYSYTTVHKDTVFQENMLLQQNADSVYLVVTVPNQNNEKPVAFKMIPVESDVFTFINELHDFPTKISYTNPVKDSIHAWVEGQIDSTYRKIDFYFKKSN